MSTKCFRNFSVEQEKAYREKNYGTIPQEISDMLMERSAVGLAKYGTTMDRVDLKGSEWCQHAIEEMLDGAQYLLRVKRIFEQQESKQKELNFG
tara:strand:- start:808 stop:1089 length:282 start_codon:yes stop_codon:yes gene_type:complete